MSPRKKKKKPLFFRISWEIALVVAAVAVVSGFIAFDYLSHGSKNASYRLSADALGAYAEAITLASKNDDVAGAVERIDRAITDATGSNAEAQYTRAKLSIYKADIMLTYGFEFQEGFDILGAEYSNKKNSDDIRSEALMLAMAHGLQGLDEGALTTADVRDFLLLNKHFSSTLNIGLPGAMLINKPQDTYEYLARGFGAAADLTKSEKVFMLARSYSLRLLSPFMIPPPSGGLYHDFIASIANIEEQLDAAASTSALGVAPYQEYVPSSYYNLARAFEALPPGDENVVDDMVRIHQKIAQYIANYPERAFGAQSFAISIGTRLVCKVVDNADFDASRIDKEALQPFLDEIYTSDGWVVPCREAFEVVAKDIDERFTKYF